MIISKTDEMRNRRFITNYLWYIKQSCLQCSSTARYQSSRRMFQQGKSLIVNHSHIRAFKKLIIIRRIYSRSSSQHHLIVGKIFSSLYHGRQIIFDFLKSASSQQSNYWLISQLITIHKVRLFLTIFSLKLPDLVCRRVPHIMNGVMMLLLKERNLEWKDGEQLIHIAFNVFDTILFPSPNLRRDIVEHRYMSVTMHIFGYLQIKARIIDKYHHIRVPRFDIFFTKRHIPKDSRQMQKHGNKAHICQFAVMLYQLTTFCSHQVTSKKTEFRFGVLLFQGFHEMRCM